MPNDHQCNFPEERDEDDKIVLLPCLDCGMLAGDALKKLVDEIVHLRAKIEAQLTLFDTDTLLKEILHRHEYAIFAGMQTAVKDPSDFFIRRRWIGNATTCAGLCTQLSYRINQHNDRETTTLESEP